MARHREDDSLDPPLGDSGRRGEGSRLGAGPQVAVVLAVLGYAAACVEEPPTKPSVVWEGYEIGQALPGLTDEERKRFEEGAELFRHIYTPEEGLGPLFNENSCNACHTDPADGGTGDQLVVKATRYSEEEGCDLLREEGGDNVRQQATAALREHGYDGDEIPDSATETGRLDVPFLFGLGLVEAIPESTIVAHAERANRRDDGIRGRVPRDEDGRLARFGRKGTVVSLFDFTEEALRLEMGITTPVHPSEVGPNRGPPIPGTDPAPNPEADWEELLFLTDFVRFLAPPPRRLPEDPVQRARVERGEALFDSIGCTGCHVPEMKTGSHPVDALDEQPVPLYSDLLLHDLGYEDGVCGPTARPSEVRTEMLMGVGSRDVFLHDSRAVSVEEAIEYHGGEAAEVRRRFRELPYEDRFAILRFLDTL